MNNYIIKVKKFMDFFVRVKKPGAHCELWPLTFVGLFNKPFVNEAYLTGQNLN